MSLNVTSETRIRDLALQSAERFAPERVVLFGSHARGDASADSDVDLMVLFSEVENPHDRAAEIRFLEQRNMVGLFVSRSTRLNPDRLTYLNADKQVGEGMPRASAI